MIFFPYPFRSRKRKRYQSSLSSAASSAAVLASLLLAAGCSQSAIPSSGKHNTALNAPAVSESAPVESDIEPSAILKQGSVALNKISSFDLEMDLTQDMVTDGSKSSMSMSNNGSIFLSPLAMKQVTVNDFMGDQSTIDSYLTQDGYYMYDYSNKSWSRMLASELPKIKATLSEFQIAPSKELDKIAPYADSFRVTDESGTQVLTYSGSGEDAAADALVRDLLRSTMGTDDMDPEIRDSIKVTALKYTLAFDRATSLMRQLKASADVSIQYEEGNPSQLHQELTLDYSSWDKAEAIRLPEEAKNAPEVMPAEQGLLDALQQ